MFTFIFLKKGFKIIIIISHYRFIKPKTPKI